MPTLEEPVRAKIDKQLEACVWTAQSRNPMKLYAGGAVAGVESAVEAKLREDCSILEEKCLKIAERSKMQF